MTHKLGDKIPTALVRDPNNRSKVLPEITPGCEWVFAGEGVPTRKWDGTCVMLDEDGKWWARREVKPGKYPPENYVVINFDEVTGKTQGWEPIEQSPYAKFHAEVLDIVLNFDMKPGTYELIGPKINGNPDGFGLYVLEMHEAAPIVHNLDFPLPPDVIMFWVKELGEYPGWEGIVWHHPDGRMAKLKAKDIL